MSDTPARAADLEFRVAGNDVVVHDPLHGRVHVLNKTAAYILQSCDGKSRAQSIAQDISQRTSVPCERALTDVERTLEELRTLALVSWVDASGVARDDDGQAA